MKLVSWNVNGIRAASIKSKSIKLLLDSLDADIICLQETKITSKIRFTRVETLVSLSSFLKSEISFLSLKYPYAMLFDV